MNTILVVDDSAVERRLVSGLLSKESRWMIHTASNGAEALARMKAVLPDVVVTDLRMPDMDGLELIAAARIYYPDVPVILMTAYGSEKLAVDALKQGAASYVPKPQLAERLRDTVLEVLTLAGGDHTRQEPLRCLTRMEFVFDLDNDVGQIHPIVELIQQMVVSMGLCGFAQRLQIGVALRAALSNAIVRGNLEISTQQMEEARERLMAGEDFNLIQERCEQEPYGGRRVALETTITEKEARFTVRDEGPGFDTSRVPAAGDPTALGAACGRGLVLMRNFMDDLVFNQAGNEVTMIKCRCPEDDPAR